MVRKKKQKKRFRLRRYLRPIRKALYWLRYRVGEYCLTGFVRRLPWIPRSFVNGFAAAAEKVTFAIFRKYRMKMEENLALAMGEEISSPEERRALIRRAWRNFAQTLLEAFWAMHASKEKILSGVAMEGEEHLKRALAKGKGVIALSAHLGNFTMIGARLAAAGYPFSVVVKQPRDRRFARLIDDYRAQLGMKTISAKPRREAVRGILKTLRANGVVLLIADEFKSVGVKVSFFGRASHAPRGPATLALRTGAATLPIFATRDPNGRLTLQIAPEIELIGGDDLEQSVAANTALFTQHLEDMVRRYPDQWNWLGFHVDGRKPRIRRRRSQRTQAESRDSLSS